MTNNIMMKLEDFKKMTLEDRLGYLFMKSQEPKPRNLVYKDGHVIGELESTGKVGEYRVVEFPRQVSIDIKIPFYDEVAPVSQEAWNSLGSTGKVEPDKSTKIIEE